MAHSSIKRAVTLYFFQVFIVKGRQWNSHKALLQSILFLLMKHFGLIGYLNKVQLTVDHGLANLLDYE